MNHKTVSLADQVFERLESDILLGKYARGQYLTELALVANKYGIISNCKIIKEINN